MAEEKSNINCLDDEYFDIGLTQKGCYTKSDNKIYAYTSADKIKDITGVPQLTIGIDNSDVYKIFSAMTLQKTCYQKTCLIALSYTDLLEKSYDDYILENDDLKNYKEYNKNIIIYCLYLSLCNFEFQSNKVKSYFKAYFPIKPRTFPDLTNHSVNDYNILIIKNLILFMSQELKNKIIDKVNSVVLEEHKIDDSYIHDFNIQFYDSLMYLIDNGSEFELFDLGYNTENKTIIEFRNVSDLYTYVNPNHNFKSKHMNIINLRTVILGIINYINNLNLNKKIKLTWGVEFETPLIFDPKIYNKYITKNNKFKVIESQRLRLKEREFVHADNTRHTGSTVNIIPTNGGENSPSLEFTPEIQKLDTRHNFPYMDCDGKTDDIECTRHIGNLELIFGIFTNTDSDKRLFMNYCAFIDDMFKNISNLMTSYKIRNNPNQRLGKSMRVSVKRRKRNSKHRKINKRNMGKYRHSKRCVCKAK